MSFEELDDCGKAWALSELAERLDGLATTADLMGDEPTAADWRRQAGLLRLEAMARFDEQTSPTPSSLDVERGL